MMLMGDSLHRKYFLCTGGGGQTGFTYIELILVGLLVSLMAGGIWAVYYSVVNTYYEEQRGTLLQDEGEWIIDLITHGGNLRGRRIYGLNSSVSKPGYPKVGFGLGFGDLHDYGVIFALDQVDGEERFAKFYVDFEGPDNPTSNLYFDLITPDNEANGDENYNENEGKGVLISQNLIQRKTGTDESSYGNYERTWFKVQLLPKGSGTDYCSGIKISFYLADTAQPLLYNYRLDRRLITPISDPVQRGRYLEAIPYPKYFSTSVYFANRE
jgi:hypothetical protein